MEKTDEKGRTSGGRSPFPVPRSSTFPFPTFELRKEAPHPSGCLRLGHPRVALGHDGRAEINHLLHGAVAGEGSVLVTVGTVVGAGQTVAFRAQLLRSAGEGHAAALTEFLFQ